MSMNLYCSGLSLQQTPTQITYMCLVQSDGSVPSKVNGEKAIHALQIYKQWLKLSVNGVMWKDKKDLDEAKEYIDEQIKIIDKFIKTNKNNIEVRMQ